MIRSIHQEIIVVLNWEAPSFKERKKNRKEKKATIIARNLSIRLSTINNEAEKNIYIRKWIEEPKHKV